MERVDELRSKLRLLRSEYKALRDDYEIIKDNLKDNLARKKAMRLEIDLLYKEYKVLSYEKTKTVCVEENKIIDLSGKI